MGAPNSFCVAVYPDVLGQNALPKRIIHSNDSPIGEEAAMNFEDLSPELRKKAKACENPEEMIALAKEEGYELSNEELDEMHKALDAEITARAFSMAASNNEDNNND